MGNLSAGRASKESVTGVVNPQEIRIDTDQQAQDTSGVNDIKPGLAEPA